MSFDAPSWDLVYGFVIRLSCSPGGRVVYSSRGEIEPLAAAMRFGGSASRIAN
jgi:hypothetical protein